MRLFDLLGSKNYREQVKSLSLRENYNPEKVNTKVKSFHEKGFSLNETVNNISKHMGPKSGEFARTCFYLLENDEPGYDMDELLQKVNAKIANNELSLNVPNEKQAEYSPSKIKHASNTAAVAARVRDMAGRVNDDDTSRFLFNMDWKIEQGEKMNSAEFETLKGLLAIYRADKPKLAASVQYENERGRKQQDLDTAFNPGTVLVSEPETGAVKRIPADQEDEYIAKGWGLAEDVGSKYSKSGLGKKNMAVVQAFVDQTSADSKKLHTDGTSLDILAMGGNGVAWWEGDKIHFRQASGRADQALIKTIRKMANPMDLAEGDKKPDCDGDGIPDYAEDGKGENDLNNKLDEAPQGDGTYHVGDELNIDGQWYSIDSYEDGVFSAMDQDGGDIEFHPGMEDHHKSNVHTNETAEYDRLRQLSGQ